LFCTKLAISSRILKLVLGLVFVLALVSTNTVFLFVISVNTVLSVRKHQVQTEPTGVHDGWKVGPSAVWHTQVSCRLNYTGRHSKRRPQRFLQPHSDVWYFETIAVQIILISSVKNIVVAQWLELQHRNQNHFCKIRTIIGLRQSSKGNENGVRETDRPSHT
jgi:hypothetical protein